MKFLKKIFWLVVILLVVALGARCVIKEKAFPYKYPEYVNTYSEKYDLDPLFVLSVMKTESNFKEDAHSHKDAVGLMQITGDTGEWIAGEMGLTGFSKDDLYNEEVNIQMGCWYLRRLLDMFNGNRDLAVAAYNAAPTNVSNWLENEEYSLNGESLHYIPFGETKKYIDKVNVYYNIYDFFYNDRGNILDINRIINLFKQVINVHISYDLKGVF